MYDEDKDGSWSEAELTKYICAKDDECTEGDVEVGFNLLYRLGQVVVDLGWIDISFGHSTTCSILLGQLEVWQNGLWTP